MYGVKYLWLKNSPAIGKKYILDLLYSCLGKRGRIQKRLLNKGRCLFKLSVEKYCLKYSNKIQLNIFNSFSTLSVQFYSWAPPACPLTVIYLIWFLIKMKAKTRITVEVECLTAIEIKCISGLKLGLELYMHPLIYPPFIFHELFTMHLAPISLKDL